MMYKDIQILENAARTAMAGNLDQPPQIRTPNRTLYFAVAILLVVVTLYLTLAI